VEDYLKNELPQLSSGTYFLVPAPILFLQKTGQPPGEDALMY